MICPKCNEDIPDKSKFCLECGSDISAVSGESGAEDDLSLGEFKTMTGKGSAPEPPSVGNLQTMTAEAAAREEQAVSAGTPLAERYEVGEEIGRGGFAVVFKARDRKLDRVVAVKRLLADKATGPQARQTIERFTREACAIAGLNHRNIVQVYDHDQDDEGHYIVMELVEGGSLRDYLRER